MAFELEADCAAASFLRGVAVSPPPRFPKTIKPIITIATQLQPFAYQGRRAFTRASADFSSAYAFR
ncbi:MAG: hypothetical protein DWI58_00100 [Chloroflexi bacterium]|nr:MAG: hypothetical protein DWI58_00100 [Chloroflexota bacterium]